jgi:transposase-like protein
MRVIRSYTEQFKSDAVAMVLRGDRSVRQVSEDLGVNHWTLRDWYRADKMAKKKGNGARSRARRGRRQRRRRPPKSASRGSRRRTLACRSRSTVLRRTARS